MRQRGLGIESYIWRSRDDSKVRHSHAAFDDQIFDWNDPPEGGHPGQDYNCRCYAEPVLPDEPDYVPDTGFGYEAARYGAELEGIAEAAKDMAVGLWEGLIAIPEALLAVGNLAKLRWREDFGTLSADERAELAQIRATIDTSVAGFVAAFKDSPRLMAAAFDYVIAVQGRPALVNEAYRQGLATREQVLQAHRERAHLQTMILANIVPATKLSKLLRRRGRDIPGDRPDRMADAALEETAKLRRHPSDVDWEIIDNPGIDWTGLRAQGEPWEDYLESLGVLGGRLPWSHKTFDFYAAGTATSAKTLDTTALTYFDRPSRIYGRLRTYVDQIDKFETDRRYAGLIREGEISVKQMLLAVPNNSTQEQVVQIQRAIEYAPEKNVRVIINFIK